MENVIELKNVSYRYPRSDCYVLKHIDLSVKRGEFIAVVGENGAGKTTLCQLLSGIIPHSQGGRLVGDVKLCGVPTQEESLSNLSRKAGIVLEDPETQLFTTSVIQEVAFGMENLEIPVEEIRERVQWALDVVTMTGYETRHPQMLSGGQKQRVAIASVLTMRPDVLVLDEPTSQLDPVGTTEVFEVVRKLRDEYGMTIVMATHKSEEMARFADRILVLSGGEILAFDTPQAVFENDEVVKKAWITRPQVSDLHLALRESRIEMGSFPITREQGVREIKRLLDASERAGVSA